MRRSGMSRFPPITARGCWQATSRPSIEAVFRVIDQYPGGAKAYLRDKMGLDQSRIARLRALYTE
ncbi:tyrosine-protein phosphatase [Novosphingobium sp.]|uniref:tyrosine-protein phosphatase n=1 Tax=Novosphingobium sp. TaxID=1874826 RepID=UPI003FA5B280